MATASATSKSSKVYALDVVDSPTLAVRAGALAVVLGYSPMALLRSQSTSKARTEHSAALANLPKAIQDAWNALERAITHNTTGLASIVDLTIPKGNGIFSGRNGEDCVREFFSPQASSGEIRKAATTMIAANVKQTA